MELDETIKLLYRLQLVDSSLDELEEMKGDLPEAVRKLQSEADRLRGLIKEKQDLATASIIGRDKADVEILNSKKIFKNTRLSGTEVRSNKEYDALTKEIDFSTDAIKKLQKQFEISKTRWQAPKRRLRL